VDFRNFYVISNSHKRRENTSMKSEPVSNAENMKSPKTDEIK